MKTKPFQYIKWNFEDDIQKITLDSQIYTDVDDFIAQIDNNIIIALGLNPSNTTVFNDDETNLYLRNKFKEKWPGCNGYLLTNLFPIIESNSSNLSIDNIDDSHIDKLIQLLQKTTDNKLVLFFGQTGVSFLNLKIGKMCKLKETLSSRIAGNTYYTSDGAKFSHPSRCKKTFLLEDFDSKILDE